MTGAISNIIVSINKNSRQRTSSFLHSVGEEMNRGKKEKNQSLMVQPTFYRLN